MKFTVGPSVENSRALNNIFGEHIGVITNSKVVLNIYMYK